MEFDTDIHAPLSVTCNNFGDYLNFIVLIRSYI